MRHIVLSDYTNQKRIERENREKKKLENYQSALLERKEKINTKKAELSGVWRQRKIWKTITELLKLFLILSIKPKPPVREPLNNEDYIWDAGRTGEKYVEDYISRTLSDDWILISGYKNYKGEIDKILVGSDGIFAIEVKYINGIISCDGDKWWKNKYDKYGNLVEIAVPIMDKGGRSPSKQLNESADLLQKDIKKAYPLCSIYRIVLLSHNRSEIGVLKNVTVDEIAVLSDWQLSDTIKKTKFKLMPTDVEKVVRIVKSNHKK